MPGTWGIRRHPSAQTCKAFSSFIFTSAGFSFWKCQTFIWSCHSFLNSDQTFPQFGKLPSQVLEGLKVNFPACLHGSWKQNISIDVHLLSYLLPENSWLLQEIFIYRKLVLCASPPPLSIKSNACNSSCDSPEPALPHTGRSARTRRGRAAGRRFGSALLITNTWLQYLVVVAEKPQQIHEL